MSWKSKEKNLSTFTQFLKQLGRAWVKLWKSTYDRVKK